MSEPLSGTGAATAALTGVSLYGLLCSADQITESCSGVLVNSIICIAVCRTRGNIARLLSPLRL